MKNCLSGSLRLFLSILVCFLLITPSILTAATLANESGKFWKFKLSANYSYDDNVVNEPTNIAFRPAFLVGKDDHIFDWSATLSLKHAFTKKLSMRATYDVDMTIHSELSQYDLTAQILGVGMVYKFAPLFNFTLDYNYIYNIVDDDNFSGIHYVSPSLNYMNKTFGLTRVFYTFKSTDNWQSDLRDNDAFSAGLKHYFFFSDFSRRIILGYKYTSDDTTGSSFDRDLHTVELRGQTPLFFGIDLDLQVEVTFREYVSRLGTDGSLRDDDQYKLVAEFKKVLFDKLGIMQNLTMKAGYRYLFNDSNLLLRDYRTNKGYVGLDARF